MIQLQIGKKGYTPEFVEQVRGLGEKVENIRISLLKSSGRDKAEVDEIKDKLLADLGSKYTGRTIGFTIILKKWRKARKKEE